VFLTPDRWHGIASAVHEGKAVILQPDNEMITDSVALKQIRQCGVQGTQPQTLQLPRQFDALGPA